MSGKITTADELVEALIDVMDGLDVSDDMHPSDIANGFVSWAALAVLGTIPVRLDNRDSVLRIRDLLLSAFKAEFDASYEVEMSFRRSLGDAEIERQIEGSPPRKGMR